MKNNGKLLVNVSDVAKRLGISFSELQKEFAECDITINEGDMVEIETVKYALSGMRSNEYSWGEELHMENGEVGSHVHWTQMRDGDGTEATIQGRMRVSSIAQKLGLDTEMFVQELSKKGYTFGADDYIGMGLMSTMIDDLELHDSWATLVGADIDTDVVVTHTHDKIHCADSCDTHYKHSTSCAADNCNTKKAKKSCATGTCASHKAQVTTNTDKKKTVYDIAMAWGMPATALTAWMGANGFEGTKFTNTQVDEMRYTMQDDISYRENYEYEHPEPVEPVTATGSWAADETTAEDAIKGVYTHSNSVDEVAAHANASNGWMKGAAWTLLGALAALPLALSLFGDRDATQVVDNPRPEIHSVAQEEIIVPSVELEEHGVQAEIDTFIERISQDDVTNGDDISGDIPSDDQEIVEGIFSIQSFLGEIQEDTHTELSPTIPIDGGLLGSYPEEYCEKLGIPCPDTSPTFGTQSVHNAPGELPRTGGN